MIADGKNGFCIQYAVKEIADKGLGIVSGEAIKQGRVVWRHIPGQYVVYDEQTFTDAISEMSYDDVVYELKHVFGLKELPGCLIRVFDDGALINHSANANLAINETAAIKPPIDLLTGNYIQNVTDSLLGDQFSLVAARNIEAGEELTHDYSVGVSDPAFYDVLCEQFGVCESYLGGD